MATRRTMTATPMQMLWGGSTLTIIVALATVSAWDIYDTTRLAMVAAVGLVIGAGSVLVGGFLGWRWWAIALLAAGGYLLAVVPTAVPGSASRLSTVPSGLASGLIEVVTGWKHLLTISVPATDYQGVLVPFFVTVLGCSFAAFAFILFGRRFRPFAVIPMVAMVAFGAVFGTSVTTVPVTLGPWTIDDSHRVFLSFLTVTVCVVWIIGNARIERASAMRVAQSTTGSAKLGAASFAFTLRRQALAAAIIAVAVLGAVVAAPVSTHFGPRQVPRDAVDPLIVVRAQPSPLGDYRQWYSANSFSAALFDVKGAESTDRLRIATLANYDGETFQVSADARFFRQPRTQDHTLTITIRDGYQGIWVPLATANGGAPSFAGPRADELADSYYADLDDDVGVVVAGASPSTAGLRSGDSYSVAAAQSVGPDSLANATGRDPLISAEDYPHLAKWVELQGLGRLGSDLTELIDRLVARGYISHGSREDAESAGWISALQSRSGYVFEASRSGHSAARVDELFGAMYDQELRAGSDASATDLVSAVGDDEQFATAAALLAAYLGFDARVVEGVRLGDTGQSLAVQPCIETCSGSNVTVWTEVRTPTGKWVTFDATPQFENLPLLIQAGQVPPENPTTPDQVASDVVEPPSVDNEHAATKATIQDAKPTWLDQYLPLVITIAIVTIGAALILMPLFIFPFAKRLRRRWRRRHRVPEVAMVGAWLELVDTYIDLGIDVPYALTRAETADVLGRQHATTIAAVVDRAVFAEHPPTREASDATWQIFDDELRTVGAEHTWRRRFRARITAASLMRAARKDVRVMRSGLVRRDRDDTL